KVAPVWQAVELAVDDDVVEHAAVGAKIEAIALDQIVDGHDLPAQHQARVHGRVLGVKDVEVFAAGQHDQDLVGVLIGGEIIHFNFDVRVSPFKGFDQLAVVLVKLVIPRSKFEHGLLSAGHRAAHDKPNHRQQADGPKPPHAHGDHSPLKLRSTHTC